ncbi:MAG: uncharacterized protein QOJ52_4045 [Acidimicrobiaceae bacterium]|nr:uncharacterized protein [Acidimicrobiaceae bacterium]
MSLVKADSRLMNLLRAVRALDIDRWCIAAGVIRNKVWDNLHNYTEPTLPSDIDVLFYDAIRTESAYEDEIEKRLSESVPTVHWEVVNQATVHTYTKDAPYQSIEEAMSRWADLVTAVGVYLTDADEIGTIAPAGLDDLFNLRVRPNLVAPNAAAIYDRRMTTKGWLERWPKLTIEKIASGTY